MPQSSSQALDPSWVSVSFAKFSHSSGLFGTRNFTWNHVGSRNDLDFILRNIRALDENRNFHNRLVMKINAGAEELEQQDLYELVQHAQAFDPSSGGESPVQLVVKSPFLAMRYPKSANMVRRIQLKFHNDADFTKILNFMKELGLPITTTMTAALPSIPRPSISPSPSLLSDTSTSTSLTLPSTLSTSSVSMANSKMSLPTLRSPFHMVTQATDESSNARLTSSTSEFKVPTRPNSSFSEPQGLGSNSNYAIPQIQRPATTSNFFPLHGPGSSHTFITPKPPTSVYVAQMEREFQSRRPSLTELLAMKSSHGDPPPNLSLYQSQMDLENRSAAERAQYTDLRLSQSPFFETRALSPEMRESRTNLPNQDHGKQAEHDVLDSGRCNTTLLNSTESTVLSAPPKRRLPFPKPREVMSRSASISALSPLPKPTPLSCPKSANFAKEDGDSTPIAKTLISLGTKNPDATPVVKPAKKRVAQRTATAAKQPEIAESPPPNQGQGNNVDATTSPQASPQDESSPLAAKSVAAASRPTSAASGLQTKTAAPKKRVAPARPSSTAKRLKMIDQSTQTERLFSPGNTSAPQSLHIETAMPIAPQLATRDLAIATPPESYLDAVDAFITMCKDRQPPQEIWERPGWAEADEDQRHQILNDFICENLENKDFLKLCEDMSVSWRRISLGM